MEIDALSAAAAADAARSLSEDRDKSAAVSMKDAKDRISELEKRIELEQQKRLQQQQAAAAKVQELTVELEA